MPLRLAASLTGSLTLLIVLLAASTSAGAIGSATPRASAASTRVPTGFVGMNVDGPALNGSVDLGGQMTTMVASGVERVRVMFDWAAAQPYATFSSMPPPPLGVHYDNVDGVPTNWAATDAAVGDAAARGLAVLPVVLAAPAWDAEHTNVPISPPQTLTPYTRFLRALIGRYGPRGSFWTAHPGLRRVPIRWWQVWNEPDHAYYWQDSPWVPGYVKLLKAAHDAIKAADRGASVVLAGTPDFSWNYLTEIYTRHARPLFDIVAEHPYTNTPNHVMQILQRVRAVMNKYGDRHKPMIATEIGYPSSRDKLPKNQLYGFETDEKGQATNTATTIRLLAARRASLGLIGFYYLTWMGAEQPGSLSFDYAGLFRFAGGHVTAKPAYRAFRSTVLSLEGCRRKGPLVSNCSR